MHTCKHNVNAGQWLFVYFHREADLLWQLLLHCLLLHDFGHCCRWFLGLALLELIDLMAIVGMVGVVGIQEVELGVVYFVLADPGLKLWPIPVTQTKSYVSRWERSKYYCLLIVMWQSLAIEVHISNDQHTWLRNLLSYRQCFGLQEVGRWSRRWAS